jgi:hypothetical protein
MSSGQNARSPFQLSSGEEIIFACPANTETSRATQSSLGWITRILTVLEFADAIGATGETAHGMIRDGLIDAHNRRGRRYSRLIK